MRASALAAVLCTAVVALAAGTPVEAAAGSGMPTPLLRLQDPALDESSGLSVSRRHEGVLWTHGDGGQVAEVRAVDSSGRTVAVVTLAGVNPYDPEALAPGELDGRPALFLGDVGDNKSERSDVSVFVFPEPAELRDQTVAAQWFRFTYPDGPHNAEALLVHPDTGRIFVATKDLSGARLYRAPRDPSPAAAGTNRLERVADVPSFVTDGAFLNDGRYVLRTYTSAYAYSGEHELLAISPLPVQPQGESIAFDGRQLLIGSEGENSAVYAVPVPEPDPEDAPEEGDGSPTDVREPSASASDEWRELGRIARAVGISVVLVALLAALVARRRRR